MTLSKWIEDYCEDNEIELPSEIPDEKTALCFLYLNKSKGSGGGGGDSDFPVWNVKINFTSTDLLNEMVIGFYGCTDDDTGEVLSLIPWNDGYFLELNERIPNGDTILNMLVINPNSASLYFYYAEGLDISCTTSGNIVYDEENQTYIISGDCEINIVKE